MESKIMNLNEVTYILTKIEYNLTRKIKFNWELDKKQVILTDFVNNSTLLIRFELIDQDNDTFIKFVCHGFSMIGQNNYHYTSNTLQIDKFAKLLTEGLVICES